jgi:hypothetical protein
VGGDRWRENWRVAGREGATRFELPRSRRRRQEVQQRLRELAPGTPVALAASAPAARRRCRAAASSVGIEIEREYLAFPSASAPAYLVDDARAAADVFANTVLVAPPRTRLSLPISIGLYLLRATSPWRILRLLAPGRVAVGRRA